MVLLIIYLVIGFIISCLCLRTSDFDIELNNQVQRVNLKRLTHGHRLLSHNERTFVRFFAATVIGLFWLPMGLYQYLKTLIK